MPARSFVTTPFSARTCGTGSAPRPLTRFGTTGHWLTSFAGGGDGEEGRLPIGVRVGNVLEAYGRHAPQENLTAGAVDKVRSQIASRCWGHHVQEGQRCDGRCRSQPVDGRCPADTSEA
jgi:hypothetical protein